MNGFVVSSNKYDVFGAARLLSIGIFIIAHGYVGDCDHSYGIQYRTNHGKNKNICNSNSKSLLFLIGSGVFSDNASSQRTSCMAKDIDTIIDIMLDSNFLYL